MTCADARPLLPAHVYGDLSDADAAAVVRHLRECPACRAEAGALDQVRLALDAPTTPPVRVDVPALFHEIAERRARRWRRLAVTAAALAAGLLLVVGLRMQVAVASDRIILSWGTESVSRDAEALRSGALPPTALRSEDSASRLTDLNDRVLIQQELLHALAADGDARDRRHQSEMTALRARLDAVQRLALDWRADAERMMSALYVAQFKRPEEKPNP